MKTLSEFSSEIANRKARAKGANILTLVNVDTLLDLIARIESASEHLSQIGGVDPQDCYRVSDEILGPINTEAT